MAEGREFDVVVQQRLQEMEEERETAEAQFSETTDTVCGVEQALQAKQQEVDRLTAELGSLHATRMQLEVEQAKRLERENAEWRESAANAEVAMQLRGLTQRLDEELARRNVAAADKLALQTELDTVKTQLEEKGKERTAMEATLQGSREREASWKKQFEKLESDVHPMKQQFDKRMEQWFGKEKEMTKALTQVTQERDALKIGLDKEHEERKRIAGVLKDTTESFKECVAALHSAQAAAAGNASQGAQEGAQLQNLEDQGGPSVPVPLQIVKLPDLPCEDFLRGDRPHLEVMTDLEDLTKEQLQEKYMDLVERFNGEVKAGIIDDVNSKVLVRYRNNAVNEKRILAFEVAEMSKLAEQRAQQLEELQKQFSEQKGHLEVLREERKQHLQEIERLEDAHDVFAAQVKFLVKRADSLEKVINGETAASPLLPSPRVPYPQTTCIHDLVESNKALTNENCKLKRDMKDYQKKLEQKDKELQEKKTKTSVEETEQVYEEQEDEDTHKRTPATQQGPSSRKKRRTQEEPSPAEETTELDPWKEKWEQAQKELSASLATQIQLKTELQQKLETVQAHNEMYVTDIKVLERNLFESQTEYKSLVQANKSQEDVVRARLSSSDARVKEMEEVIRMMTNEVKDLEMKLTEQKTAVEIAGYKIETERKAFSDLQRRTIGMEAEHMEEMQRLKDDIETQMGEKIRERAAAQVAVGEQEGQEGMSAETVEDIRRQLEEKDCALKELTRRLISAEETLAQDMLSELQSKLTLAETHLALEQQQTRNLRAALDQANQKHETEMKSAAEAFEQTAQKNQALATELEAERDAQNLEILKWKGQCEKNQMQEENVYKEINAMRVSLSETTQDFQARLKKVKSENEDLKEQLLERTTLVDSTKEKIEELSQQLDARTEEVKQLKKEKEEAEAAEQEEKKIIEDTPMTTEPTVEPEEITVQPTSVEADVPEQEEMMDVSEETKVLVAGDPSTESPPKTTEITPEEKSPESLSPPVPAISQDPKLEALLKNALQSVKGPAKKKPRHQLDSSSQSSPQPSINSSSQARPKRQLTVFDLPQTTEQVQKDREAAQKMLQKPQTPTTETSVGPGAEEANKPESGKQEPGKRKWTRIRYTPGPKKDDQADDKKKEKGPKQ